MAKQEDLRTIILELLEDAGFSPELYLIKNEVDGLSVHFDDSGAVKYFRRELELSQWAKELILEERKDGKRYVAYLQTW